MGRPGSPPASMSSPALSVRRQKLSAGVRPGAVACRPYQPPKVAAVPSLRGPWQASSQRSRRGDHPGDVIGTARVGRRSRRSRGGAAAEIPPGVGQLARQHDRRRPSNPREGVEARISRKVRLSGTALSRRSRGISAGSERMTRSGHLVFASRTGTVGGRRSSRCWLSARGGVSGADLAVSVAGDESGPFLAGEVAAGAWHMRGSPGRGCRRARGEVRGRWR